MVFTQIFKWSSLILLISTLWFYSQYKSEQADNAVLRANQVALEDSIELQKSTIESMVKEKELLNQSIVTLSKSHNNIMGNLSTAMNDIAALRAEEAKRAIENPYERGNAALNRLNDRMQSITGKADTNTN